MVDDAARHWASWIEFLRSSSATFSLRVSCSAVVSKNRPWDEEREISVRGHTIVAVCLLSVFRSVRMVIARASRCSASLCTTFTVSSDRQLEIVRQTSRR
jgi:hypothetical protein